ncbi:MAG TPA: hypothetical protein VF540_00425 [Segetibacter sp.]
MRHLTSEEANLLANNFLALARAAGDYRFANWKNLSGTEKEELGNLQDCLLDQGEKILAQSVSLVMDEVAQSLNSIQIITNKIKDALQQLKDLQKVINIGAAAVTLGSAILTKDLTAIGEGIAGLATTVKES